MLWLSKNQHQIDKNRPKLSASEDKVINSWCWTEFMKKEVGISQHMIRHSGLITVKKRAYIKINK
jgi:hypothetical protein